MYHEELKLIVMSKYTFVIPAYNVKKYLEQCVDSILSQTYRDYKILIIDDGSKDGTSELCDQIANKNDKVCTYHKENGGLSSARNYGLERCTSEYVIFLDSDDFWCDKEGLQKIDSIVCSKEVDVVVFASKDYYEETGEMVDDGYNYPSWLNECSPEECLKGMISHGLLNMSAAKKVYRREFLVDYDLFFEPGIKSEDVEQGIRMINCLPRYAVINEKLYVYRHRKGSISTSVDRKHIEDYIKIIEKYAVYSYTNDSIREYILSYVGYQYALLLAHSEKIHDRALKEKVNSLKKYSFLLKYDKYPRTKKVGIIYSILGFRLTKVLLYLYLKRKSI